ncbi:FAD binding domain-containing protein [Pseudovirgaria hyperparasitica]|uniref:FAD binding domain-containing protein n=1 Tax=Pseudovirgaria hyperparasitica TaxID=470096 RepID=A0A6A6W263_9PEZI|nr:FAD binding domain-containing protein [Pseudovirgaria hyperparasitica]KAF2755677.1 FAD binding domain-containing protein [Pseudovirgaria hyperparasitica]
MSASESDVQHHMVELSRQLTDQSTASPGSDAPLRWSTYKQPRAKIVVNAGCEEDVETTVRFCNSKAIPFLAQNGANGWSSSFGLDDEGVIINLAGLDHFTVNEDKTLATIGGGSTVKNTIEAAYANGVQVVTGNCNCVGTIGAYLGGGYGYLMGHHSFGMDNVVSLRVVTAESILKTVSMTSEPDLFWAMRGAGPNFGIVTSATVKAFAVTPKENKAWSALVGFHPDKLEQVVEAIDKLQLTPDTNVFMYLASSQDEQHTPIVLIVPFYLHGNEEQGHDFFKALYDIGPLFDQHSVKEYNEWNAGGDPFCARGPRKPVYSAGHHRMIPSTWRAIWNEFVKFQQLPGASLSAVLLERYHLSKAQSFPVDSTAYAHRDMEFSTIVMGTYEDEALDAQAEAFGKRVRQILRENDGYEMPKVYSNFAHGDESNEIVYSTNLPRLRELKKQFDPQNRFGHWFPIQ